MATTNKFRRRRVLLAGAWVLAVAGCTHQPWTYADKEEAYRMCRGEVPLPVINVFEPDARAFGTFMCACQVEVLSRAIGHEKFLNPLFVADVNGALSEARSSCLMAHRDGQPAGAR